MTDHMKKINSSFTDQAKSFENANMNFSKKEYLDYTMKAIGAARTDLVLEPAAGTCVCGRTLAPMVQKVSLSLVSLKTFPFRMRPLIS